MKSPVYEVGTETGDQQTLSGHMDAILSVLAQGNPERVADLMA